MKCSVVCLATLLAVCVMLSSALENVKGKGSMGMMKKIAAAVPTKPVSGTVEDSKLPFKTAKLWKRNLLCPDGQSECPTGNTCCKLLSSSYGCCPQPNAVCCSNGINCCPYGFTCGAGGNCEK